MDKSIDEPNPKRPKLNRDASSSNSSSKQPVGILSLPSDILAKIFLDHIPLMQWIELELQFNSTFSSAIQIAWRELRDVNVERVFMTKPECISDDPSLFRSVRTTITSVGSSLRQLVERSPFLTSLSGVDLQWTKVALNSEAVSSLIKFEHLRSITIGDGKLFVQSQGQGTPLECVVEFLELTRSRATLKEIRLFNVVHQYGADRATILDRFATSLVDVKLEKFVLTSPDHSRLWIPRLDTLDTSRLIELRVGKVSIEPEQLIDVIERSSSLRRIEVSFFKCHRGQQCDGRHLEANKKLLAALASHENLTAITIDIHIEYGNDMGCMNFGHRFVEMLQSIGRRGGLRKLAMEIHVLPPIIDMNGIYSTICEHLPYLRSIKISVHRISDENIRKLLVSLTMLEEIHFTNDFTNDWHQQVTADTIGKIAQLQHLKRLAVNRLPLEGLDSLKSLPKLEDLRIICANVINRHIFEQWADNGCFVANLRVLMLSEIADENQDDEIGLCRLLEKASRLRVLILNGRITDRTLMTIAQKSRPQLEVLGVRTPWYLITVQGLQDVVDQCPNLRRLSGFGERFRKQLRVPKYRKLGDVDTWFWKYGFDDCEFD